MELDAVFSKDGHDYGVALENGMLNVHVDGAWVGGIFVGALPPIPDASVIEVEPEFGPELPADGEPDIE